LQNANLNFAIAILQFAICLMSTTLQTIDERRALRIRRRPDLHAVPQTLRGERYWVIKDPASLKYFQLNEEEYFLLEQLDGRVSLEQIRTRFESRFAPRRLNVMQLHSFVGSLHQEGLVIGDAPGQADVLLGRKHEQARRARWMKLASVLAMRFRGVDPQRFLNWLEPRFGWFFSRPAVISVGLLAAAAVALVTVHARELSLRLPEFERFLSGKNVALLLVTLAVVKILHELGHALACRRFGGECHEIGPMLLMFTPCLYCNVTDAWMLPNKWHRAAVAAAGIYVELALAAIATFLWWWSEPGVFNALCLDVMVVCSASTLLFNGNPLLRYDGYYVFSDLMEVPNLQERASRVLSNLIAKWFLGFVPTADRLDSQARGRGWLLLYGVASLGYRLFVVAAVLWGLHMVLKPYRLEILANGAAIVTIVGMLLVPMMKATRMIRNPHLGERLRPLRLFVRTAITVAALGAIAVIPLPARITAPAVIRPVGAERVYVTVPGRITETVAEGSRVAAGDTIVRLRNDEITLATERARSERDEQQLHVENLRRQAVGMPKAAEQIPAAEALLADLVQQLVKRQAEQDQLTVVARTSGTVLPPPAQFEKPDESTLPNWSGRPLDPRNASAQLETGTLVCLVGDPRQMEGVALVNQSDVELVRVGQQVSLVADLYPGERFAGKIVELSATNADELPHELMPRDKALFHTDRHGDHQLVGTWYLARVQLDPSAKPLLISTTGDARIYVVPQSLAHRMVRWLAATFRVKW
jgi:putative peptide zinc metalloprotease protein